MKIWFDVCDKEEATLFCSADEAALCEGCDRRVHHAKQASWQTLVSLFSSQPSKNPHFVTSVKREVHFFFVKKIEQFFVENVTLQSTEPMNIPKNITGFFSRVLSSLLLLLPPSLNPTSSSSNGYGATIDSESKSSQSSKRFHSVSNNEIFSSPSIEKPLPSTTYRVEDN
ncbi:hypothetical protein CRYUN_Cryun04dG0039900 [Craigia yunnanensis]